MQPLPTGTPHIVQRGGFYGRYLPSGHLTWVHDGTLFAAPFDLTTLAVTGPAVPVVPGVLSSTNSGNAQVEVSHTGTLVYLPGGENRVGGPARLADPRRQDDAAQDHAGQLERRADRPGRPPAGLLAHGRGEHGRVDVRCGARRADTVDVRSRRGSQSGLDAGWAAAGLRLLAQRRRAEPLLAAGGRQRGRDAADDQPEHTVSGVVAPERPLPRVSRNPAADGHRSADPAGRGRRGERLEARHADRVSEWAVSPSSSRASRRTGGGWPTNRTSRATFEIYVRPFPGPGGKSPISTGGGTNAVWSRARRELLYLAPDGRIMVVPYTAAGDAFQAEKPRVWSETPVQLRPLSGPASICTRTASAWRWRRATAATAGPTHVTLIFNFFDELRRLAPVK